jgi:ParB family transcriptional regulator, chromosome partitioning protein
MTKNDKPSLGKGLGAILGTMDISNINNPKNHIAAGNNSLIKIDSIELNPFQPRKHFDEKELQELSQSIKEDGLIQPITVRPVENGKYQLISGERRLRASKLLGLTEIAAYVRTADDMHTAQMSLVENLQRSDLNAIEVAVSFQLLMDECGLSQEEISEKVGKDRSTVSNYLRLLKLSPEAQVAVRDNLVSMGHARAIVAVEDEELQSKIIRQVINDKLSVRQTETLVKKHLSELKTPKTKVKITLSDEVRSFQTDFSKKLNAKVNIRKDISGKGSLSIPFKSDDDLRRIIALLQ